MTTHIVTLGGGGFSMSNNGSATSLDRFIVDLAGKRAPLVCFAPTASGDDAGYINRFLMAYGALGVRTMVLTLWENAAESVARLHEADVVIAGAGSSANLRALWLTHGVDRVIQDMASSSSDVVFAGLAAGATIWYEGCVTDSFGDYRTWPHGLGLLKGSFCPHWDGEPARQPVFLNAIADGDLPAGWAVEVGAALHWADGTLTEVVAEEPGCGAYKIEPTNEPSSSGIITIPMPGQLV